MQPDLIAKKIRMNLVSQKEKLLEYLKLLDFENNDLNNNNADNLLHHIELEKNILEELKEFKKILEPLELMYYSSPYKKDEDLKSIKKNLEVLTKEIHKKTDVNILKLDTIIDNIKLEWNNKTKLLRKNNFYDRVEPKLVDVRR